MEMTLEHRRKTGAFYTPPLWAEWHRDTEWTPWAIHPFEYEGDPHRYWATHLGEEEREQVRREWHLFYG